MEGWKENFIFYNSMSRSGNYYAKWNKPVRERHTTWTHLYVEPNVQNQLMKKIETEAWKHWTDWQLWAGRRFGGLDGRQWED